jgi:BirA family biotin operon repressor/biotin-[acetyl-CoA-carboxylase] ligase
MILEFDEVDSTQDIAHAKAAAGAPEGTVIVARAQRAGRGREGRRWISGHERGVWCSIVERPAAQAVALLAIRVALEVAESLDQWSDERVLVKWPNDLLVGGRKLAGILIDARWNGAAVAWVAIGVGVNVVAPVGVDGAGLRAGTPRESVLEAVVGAVRRAAAETRDRLGVEELDRLAARDALAGRRILSPGVGTVQGIDASGALVVGAQRHRSGTVTLESET